MRVRQLQHVSEYVDHRRWANCNMRLCLDPGCDYRVLHEDHTLHSVLQNVRPGVAAGACVPVFCQLPIRTVASTPICSPGQLHRLTPSRSVQCYGLLADRPSSNPALRFGQFERTRRRNDSWGDEPGQGLMTMQGTIGKTAILLLITLCGAGYVWQQTAMQLAAATSTAAIVSLKGSLSQIAMVCFHQHLPHSCARTVNIKVAWHVIGHKNAAYK